MLIIISVLLMMARFELIKGGKLVGLICSSFYLPGEHFPSIIVSPYVLAL